jgi:hypothetical protein
MNHDMAGRHALSISMINPPPNFGGLKFESDPGEIGCAFHRAGAKIGKKGAFFKGIKDLLGNHTHL